MNSDFPLKSRSYGTGFRRLRQTLAAGTIVLFLAMVLFWLNADTAQASPCGSTSTANSGRTTRGTASRRQTCNNPSAQADSLTRNDSRYSREAGKSGGRSTASPSTGANDGGSESSGSSSDSNSTSSSKKTGPPVAKRKK